MGERQRGDDEDGLGGEGGVETAVGCKINKYVLNK